MMSKGLLGADDSDLAPDGRTGRIRSSILLAVLALSLLLRNLFYFLTRSWEASFIPTSYSTIYYSTEGARTYLIRHLLLWGFLASASASLLLFLKERRAS